MTEPDTIQEMRRDERYARHSRKMSTCHMAAHSNPLEVGWGLAGKG